MRAKISSCFHLAISISDTWKASTFAATCEKGNGLIVFAVLGSGRGLEPLLDGPVEQLRMRTSKAQDTILPNHIATILS